MVQPNISVNIDIMSAPKKFIKINGVIKLNPEYKRWKAERDPSARPATAVLSSSNALAIRSATEQSNPPFASSAEVIPTANGNYPTANVLPGTVEQGSSVSLSTLTEGDNIVAAEVNDVAPVPSDVVVKAESTIISELTSKEIAIRPDRPYRPDPPGIHVDQLSQSFLRSILETVRNSRWIRAQSFLLSILEAVRNIRWIRAQSFLLSILEAVRNIRWIRAILGAFIMLIIFGHEFFREGPMHGDTDSLSSRSQPSELVEPATSERGSLFDFPVSERTKI